MRGGKEGQRRLKCKRSREHYSAFGLTDEDGGDSAHSARDEALDRRTTLLGDLFLLGLERIGLVGRGSLLGACAYSSAGRARELRERDGSKSVGTTRSFTQLVVRCPFAVRRGSRDVPTYHSRLFALGNQGVRLSNEERAEICVHASRSKSASGRLPRRRRNPTRRPPATPNTQTRLVPDSCVPPLHRIQLAAPAGRLKSFLGAHPSAGSPTVPLVAKMIRVLIPASLSSACRGLDPPSMALGLALRKRLAFCSNRDSCSGLKDPSRTRQTSATPDRNWHGTPRTTLIPLELRPLRACAATCSTKPQDADAGRERHAARPDGRQRRGGPRSRGRPRRGALVRRYALKLSSTETFPKQQPPSEVRQAKQARACSVH